MVFYRFTFFAAFTVLGLTLISGCRDHDGVDDIDPREHSHAIDVEVVDTGELKERIANGDSELVMVHIWATWCAPCRKEFPELVELADFPPIDRVNVILLSVDSADELAEVAAFLEDQKSPWGSLLALSLDEEFLDIFSADWGGAIPATFFFAPDGSPLEWWDGAKSREHYEQVIKTLLDGLAEK